MLLEEEAQSIDLAFRGGQLEVPGYVKLTDFGFAKVIERLGEVLASHWHGLAMGIRFKASTS